MGESYEFPSVAWVTVGAVGEPGNRVFLLQANHLGETVTIKVEKLQVSSLVEYLKGLLERLPRPGHLPEDRDLEPPFEPKWAAGRIGIAVDPATEIIEIELEELSEDEEDRGRVLIGVDKEQAAYLTIEGTRLVQSGRPPCPLCGYPLDSRGHVCPKTNGNSAPII
ncbi:MAG: DUF3090 family protein [Acidimicrobiaceae bacterium]|nr:DUF3090 family protein [Acidimicrobiaceae bacterium]